MRFRAAGLVAKDELWRLVRSSRGAVFVVVVALVAVGSALALDGFIRGFAEETGIRIEPGVDPAPWSMDQVLRDRLRRFGEGRPLIEAALNRKISIPGALLLGVAGFVVPWLLIIAGHARICEERRSGYARFLFLRIHRSAYTGGKLVALWAFGSAVVALGVAGHALWWSTRGASTLGEVPSLVVRSSVFCFPHAALVTLASTVARTPVVALSLATGALVLLGFSAAVADAWQGSSLAWWWFGQWTSLLWSGQPRAAAVFCGSGLAFGLAAGWLAARPA